MKGYNVYNRLCMKCGEAKESGKHQQQNLRELVFKMVLEARVDEVEFLSRQTEVGKGNQQRPSQAKEEVYAKGGAS
jgi:hypothetical protein